MPPYLVLKYTQGAGTTVPGFGIFAGGQNSSGISVATTDLFTFSNESVSSLTSLTHPAVTLTGAGTSAKFYAIGGNQSGVGDITTINRYTFPDGTKLSNISLNTALSEMGTIGNSTKAIVAKGTGSSQIITYASDTVSAGGNMLSVSRYYTTGVNNTTVGLFTGGYQPYSARNNVDRIDIASQSSAATGSLANARYRHQGWSTASVAYVNGGNNGASSRLQTTEKYAYAGSTWTSSSALGYVEGAGVAADSQTAYFGGGYVGQSTTAPSSTITKFDIATETFSTPTTTLGAARGYLAGGSNVHAGLS